MLFFNPMKGSVCLKQSSLDDTGVDHLSVLNESRLLIPSLVSVVSTPWLVQTGIKYHAIGRVHGVSLGCSHLKNVERKQKSASVGWSVKNLVFFKAYWGPKCPHTALSLQLTRKPVFQSSCNSRSPQTERTEEFSFSQLSVGLWWGSEQIFVHCIHADCVLSIWYQCHNCNSMTDIYILFVCLKIDRKAFFSCLLVCLGLNNCERKPVSPYIVRTMQQHCSTAMTWFNVVFKKKKKMMISLTDDSLNASVL